MLKILIAEDEAIIALSLSSMMTDMGHGVVGPFPTVRQAIRALADAVVDVALIDYRLADGTAERLVAALQDQRIPFIWMSGFDRAGFAQDGAPVLGKPFRPEDLEAAILAAGRRG